MVYFACSVYIPVLRRANWCTYIIVKKRVIRPVWLKDHSLTYRFSRGKLCYSHQEAKYLKADLAPKNSQPTGKLINSENYVNKYCLDQKDGLVSLHDNNDRQTIAPGVLLIACRTVFNRHKLIIDQNAKR